MTPPDDEDTHYHVNDRIQYVGPDDAELRPGEIGTVIQNGRRGSVLVRFPNQRRIQVREGDERFRRLRLEW